MNAKPKREKAAGNKLGEVTWIAELAEPYLRGYTPVREEGPDLQGYWFEAPVGDGRSGRPKRDGNRKAGRRFGFFVGYLLRAGKFPFLNAETPECLVFVTLGHPGNDLHEKLVAPSESLLHRTHTYIGWLTHRPPRFAFFGDQFITLVRHRTMRDWPEEKYAHFSRNFFIESLAWLVRSGLVRKLREASKG